MSSQETSRRNRTPLNRKKRQEPPKTRKRQIQPPTEQEIQVFCFIANYISYYEYPPSNENIAEAMGFSSNNQACEILKRLHKKGLINKAPAISRGIKILRKDLAEELTGVQLRFE